MQLEYLCLPPLLRPPDEYKKMGSLGRQLQENIFVIGAVFASTMDMIDVRDDVRKMFTYSAQLLVQQRTRLMVLRASGLGS